jgi:hypothetical protein
MRRKSTGFDQKKEVRKLARERVGTVKPSRPLVPRTEREKPKHKQSPLSEVSEA